MLTMVREAFQVAQQEQPGPVGLELPEDIAGEEATDLHAVPPHPMSLPWLVRRRWTVRAANESKAQRPLIMLGAAASRPAVRRGAVRTYPSSPRTHPVFNTQW